MAGEMNWSPRRALRRAAAFGGFGLVIQLGSAFHWTPLTFILSTVVGLPAVGMGALLFFAAVLRILKSKGAF